MVHHCLERWSKALDLPLPVSYHGHRSNYEGGARSPSSRPLVEKKGDYLDGLAQAHVIGQAAAQAKPVQEGHPRVAPYLVWTQGPLEALWRWQLSHGHAGRHFPQQLSDPAFSLQPYDRYT